MEEPALSEDHADPSDEPGAESRRTGDCNGGPAAGPAAADGMSGVNLSGAVAEVMGSRTRLRDCSAAITWEEKAGPEPLGG